MGLIVGASIDHRAVGRSHLHHGTIVVLPKGIGRQICGTHILRRINQGIRTRLTGQINVRLLPESENLLIPGKDVRAQLVGNLHHRVVAGIHQRLLQRFHSMTAPVDTVDIMSSHMLHTVAVVGVRRGYLAGFKPRRHRIAGAAAKGGRAFTEPLGRVVEQGLQQRLRFLVVRPLPGQQTKGAGPAGQQAAGAVRMADAHAQALHGAHQSGILLPTRLQKQQQKELTATIALPHPRQQFQHERMHSFSP